MQDDERLDPRTVITPEAFQVSEDLLGRPLASPWRRGAAMLVDLVAVAILANAGGVFLAAALALFLFRVAKPSPEDGAMKRGLRVTVGVLAAIVAFVTVVEVWDSAFDPGTTEAPDVTEQAVEEVVTMSLGEAGATAAEVLAFRRAQDPSEARATARRIARRMGRLGLTTPEIREALLEISEINPAPWARAAVESALVVIDTAAARRRLTGDSLTLAYATALGEGDSARAAELRPELAEAVAGERLEALQTRLERVRSRNRELQRELDRAEENPGILAFLGNITDELGIGFGWMGLYFTFFLAVWKGRTPGKRLLGIRVLRLDGKPITWWTAFNRFGGYAASIFTGLMGFAEMFWDPNRQALHDRIAHTAVIRE